jgi:DNA topoisomerase 2-associated protein PAT1
MRAVSAREAQKQAHEALIRETERMQLEQLRLRELQETRMLSQFQQLQLQQQGLPQHQQPLQHQQQYRNTPPPRMLPGTQSPRFQHQLQEQILALQQQQAREKQQQLQRLEREGLYRLMMGRESPHQQFPDDISLQAQQSQPNLTELQAAQMQRLRQQQPQQQQQHMPHIPRGQSPFDVNPSLAQNTPNMPHDIQSQQRLMSQAAKAMFHGMSRFNQEEVRAEAMRKIIETEKMEDRRKRKAEKIAAMVGISTALIQPKF